MRNVLIPSAAMKLHGEPCGAYSAGSIAPGHFVKICALGERLWVVAAASHRTHIEGRLLTKPILPLHGLEWGLPMRVEGHYILEAVEPLSALSADLARLSLMAGT